jgi:DNA-binding XRE family transcriptional regulator
MSGHLHGGYPEEMKGRSSPRMRVRGIPAMIRRRGFSLKRGREEYAKVMDIGPKGLSLTCESPLEPDTRLAITVMIPGKRLIRCAGTVRNLRKSDMGYVMGLEFTRLTDRDRRFLTRNMVEIAGVDVLETCRMLKDRIRGLRTAMGLTVSELSDLTGVPPQRIVQIEFGMEKKPPDDVLLRIAQGLGISLEELIGEEPYPEEELTAEALASRLVFP